MKEELKKIWAQYEDSLLHFVQDLVRIQSFSDQEEALAKCILAKMQELGYDEAFIDNTGNVVGQIGDGSRSILFDSHMDTVEVPDEPEWDVPPFSGDIIDGRLHGRGSVDMKSALACAVYAGIVAKKLGWHEGKTIYVTCTVCEEFCDGVSLQQLLDGEKIQPDYVVICEPSDNVITLGHKGKAQIRVTTHGVSAHGSAPEKGVNAVYEMAEIIQRVEKTNLQLMAAGNPHGTMVLSDISCVSASLNAVPSSCSIYLDRRMALGEKEEDIKKEMDTIIKGKNASWAIGVLARKSWKGTDIVYEPLHEAWKIADDHPLTLACNQAYKDTYGKDPEIYDFWDFGTNAVTPIRMGIPTIGFGPGEYKLAHMRNESCETGKIVDACQFYTNLIQQI